MKILGLSRPEKSRDWTWIPSRPVPEWNSSERWTLVPAQWGGARLFAASEGHPHGNGRNSETKSLKMDPKVPNRPPSRGLQTGHWRNPGSYSKKRTFGPKSENFGPKKKTHFLPLTMFRPRPGNVVQRKKYRFTKSSTGNNRFGGVYIAKNGVLAIFSLFGPTDKRPFLRNSDSKRVQTRTGSFFW